MGGDCSLFLLFSEHSGSFQWCLRALLTWKPEFFSSKFGRAFGIGKLRLQRNVKMKASLQGVRYVHHKHASERGFF